MQMTHQHFGHFHRIDAHPEQVRMELQGAIGFTVSQAGIEHNHIVPGNYAKGLDFHKKASGWPFLQYVAFHIERYKLLCLVNSESALAQWMDLHGFGDFYRHTA
jgi:hypothetical protein